MPNFRTLDDLDVKGKRVLVRADLNVPMKDGKITDSSRIDRQAPTIKELADKGAKVIVALPFRAAQGQARAVHVARAHRGAAGQGRRPRGCVRRRLHRPGCGKRRRQIARWRCAAAGKHALPRRRRGQRSGLRQADRQARRPLRQRRLLRRASRACDDIGASPIFSPPPLDARCRRSWSISTRRSAIPSAR